MSTHLSPVFKARRLITVDIHVFTVTFCNNWSKNRFSGPPASTCWSRHQTTAKSVTTTVLSKCFNIHNKTSGMKNSTETSAQCMPTLCSCSMLKMSRCLLNISYHILSVSSMMFYILPSSSFHLRPNFCSLSLHKQDFLLIQIQLFIYTLHR